MYCTGDVRLHAHDAACAESHAKWGQCVACKATVGQSVCKVQKTSCAPTCLTGEPCMTVGLHVLMLTLLLPDGHTAENIEVMGEESHGPCLRVCIAM